MLSKVKLHQFLNHLQESLGEIVQKKGKNPLGWVEKVKILY